MLLQTSLFLLLATATNFIIHDEVEDQITEARARISCLYSDSTKKTKLADLTTENIYRVQHVVNEPLWIDSWNGDAYDDACLVLTSTGVVQADCNSNYGFLCSFESPLDVQVKEDNVFYIHAKDQLTENRARISCVYSDYGNWSKLADISSDIIEELQSHIKDPLWIDTWNGDSYEDSCLLLTATGVVSADCSEKHGYLCSARVEYIDESSEYYTESSGSWYVPESSETSSGEYSFGLHSSDYNSTESSDIYTTDSVDSYIDSEESYRTRSRYFQSLQNEKYDNVLAELQELS